MVENPLRFLAADSEINFCLKSFGNSIVVLITLYPYHTIFEMHMHVK